MKTTILKFFPALLLMLVLGACSKSGDMNDLLKTVPADSPSVLTFNATEVLNQLDYKVEDGKATYCKELKDFLAQTGASETDIRKVTDGIDLTKKSLVLFVYNDNMFITFSVEKADDFKTWYTSVNKDDKFEQEADGFESANRGSIMIKGNQVWISSGKIDTDTLVKFLDLGDNSFAEKYPATTSAMCEPNNSVCGFLNIDNTLAIARKAGDTDLVAQIQIARGIAFKDAAYLQLICKLDSDGSQGELNVLNEKEEPAEFLIPMGKISTASMNKVDNNAAVLAAVDFSPEFMKTVSMFAEKYTANAPEEALMVFDLLKKLSGTTAFSFNSEKDWLASVSFADNSAASQAGGLMAQSGIGANFSTAGNFLLARMGNATGAGEAPKEFKDNFIAMQFNYASPALRALVPMDMSKLNKVIVLVGPNGKGVTIKSIWKMKEPVKVSLSLASQLFSAAVSNYATYPEEYYSDDADSVAYDDSIADFEPEPDSDIDF